MEESMSSSDKRKLAKRVYYEENKEKVLESQKKQKNERYKNDPEFRARCLAYNKARDVPKQPPKEKTEKIVKPKGLTAKQLLETAMEVVGKEKMEEILALVKKTNYEI
jgi:hypothetical protein